MLHPDVCGGSADGILAVHSLSKRSNLAGYRCAFVAGDAAVVGELLAVRKNLGLMMPAPQQVAMAAALARHRRTRRSSTRRTPPGARCCGPRSRGPASGSTTPRRRCTSGPRPRARGLLGTVADLAERGILVAPGDFYGPAGARHVRVAFTATDERSSRQRAAG